LRRFVDEDRGLHEFAAVVPLKASPRPKIPKRSLKTLKAAKKTAAKKAPGKAAAAKKKVAKKTTVAKKFKGVRREKGSR
jgi:hypothetical protein